MNRKISCWLAVAVAVALVGVSAPAAAGPVATAEAGSAGVEWRATQPGMGLVLTVSGPDSFYLRQEFGPGVAATFSVFDAEGGVRPAGTYAYELRAVPQVDESVRQQLQDVRESGGDGGALLKAGKLPATAAPQSGAFSIVDGAILMGQETEPDAGGPAPGGNRLATKDVVYNDDLIVTGSLCVGFDCVNGESFGFDTIRLKENNLRIKFEDTSSTSGFPTTDWQLTANDSASGGLNKFSIEDITGARVPFTVVGGAPTNSIYVDSTGRVGFRTSTPVLDLHVSTTNTPALRLEQTSAGGFTAQTWDVAGNEANFFVRDVTTGSKLPFRIRPGAPTSSIDISATGNVGIATASPDTLLHVKSGKGEARVEATSAGGSDHASLFLEQSGAANTSEWEIRANATTASLEIRDVGSAGSALKFQETAANNSLVVAAAVGGFARVGIGTANPAGNAGANSLDVNGAIFQRGAQLHADYVFEPDYELESIEEHARFMWENKHLPAIPPRTVDESGREVIELGRHNRGIVEELEKAHIYIDLLKQEGDEKQAKLAQLERTKAALEESQADLARRVGLLEERLREVEGDTDR